jgi:hypothetical protein
LGKRGVGRPRLPRFEISFDSSPPSRGLKVRGSDPHVLLWLEKRSPCSQEIASPRRGVCVKREKEEGQLKV